MNAKDKFLQRLLFVPVGGATLLPLGLCRDLGGATLLPLGLCRDLGGATLLPLGLCRDLGGAVSQVNSFLFLQQQEHLLP